MFMLRKSRSIYRGCLEEIECFKCRSCLVKLDSQFASLATVLWELLNRLFFFSSSDLEYANICSFDLRRKMRKNDVN